MIVGDKTILPGIETMKPESKHIKSSIRPELFWDVDFNELNLDAHAAFVIGRVMERGTRSEVRAIWDYFGRKTIKHHLTTAKSLSPKTISYFANIFKMSRSGFRSSVTQDHVKTWP